MATITDATLQGEWFYVEEEQLLDQTASNFYVLRAGTVTTGEVSEVVGSYSIEGRASGDRFSPYYTVHDKDLA